MVVGSGLGILRRRDTGSCASTTKGSLLTVGIGNRQRGRSVTDFIFIIYVASERALTLTTWPWLLLCCTAKWIGTMAGIFNGERLIAPKGILIMRRILI